MYLTPDSKDIYIGLSKIEQLTRHTRTSINLIQVGQANSPIGTDMIAKRFDTVFISFHQLSLYATVGVTYLSHIVQTPTLTGQR